MEQKEVMSQINYKLFYYINQLAGRNLIVDKLGIIFAAYMPVVFVLWASYLWFWGDYEKRNIVLFSLYASLIGLVINYIITKVYFHPRPFMLHMGKLLIPHSPETSFPSDHATLMLSIAIIAICFKNTRASGVVLFILGILGGTARVFCGLHFPMDIMGSLGVAIISSSFICLGKLRISIVNKRLVVIYDRVLERLKLRKR